MALGSEFGLPGARTKVMAFVDTMAGYNFLSRGLFQSIQLKDPEGHTWKRTKQVVAFTVAVGFREFKVSTADVYTTIQGWSGWVRYGIGNVNSDCILGAPFCRKFVQRVEYPTNRITAKDAVGTEYELQGEAASNERSSFSLCGPKGEIEEVEKVGEAFLLVEPRSTTEELDQEYREMEEMTRVTLSDEVALSPEQKERVAKLLEEYKDVFLPRTGPPPERVPGELFKIELAPNATPKSKPFYRMSSPMVDALKELIDQYVEEGKMRPSPGSAWGAPVILVRKNDGGFRAVFDYRQLNEITIKDKHPLPRIEDYLRSLAGARIFSAADALDGFHQILVAPEDRHKTAVTTPFGQYEWTVMPMGVSNAPAMFQRVMFRIFGGHPGVKVYMDDILVHSRSEEQHFEDVRWMLQCCREQDVRLKKSKCVFFQERLIWVGHEVQRGHLGRAPRLTDKIEQFERPHTQKENQRFLGLCNYYRKFIEGYSELSSPLTALNTTSMAYDFMSYWGEPQEEAFQKLKKALVTAPLLRLYDPKLPTRVETDASDVAMGGVLSQKHDDGFHPVEYWSKQFSDAQANYHASERETCAVVFALTFWRTLLQGVEFFVLTDNTATKHLLTKPTENLTQREARWIETMGELAPFKLEYRPGEKNVAADFLSREGRDLDGRPWVILEVFPRSGTLLRAMCELARRMGRSVKYYVVEPDEAKRAHMQKVHDRLRLNDRRLIRDKNLFKYGFDLHFLAARKRIKDLDLVVIDLRRAGEATEPRETEELLARARATTLLLDRFPRTDRLIITESDQGEIGLKTEELEWTQRVHENWEERMETTIVVRGTIERPDSLGDEAVTQVVVEDINQIEAGIGLLPKDTDVVGTTTKERTRWCRASMPVGWWTLVLGKWAHERNGLETTDSPSMPWESCPVMSIYALTTDAETRTRLHEAIERDADYESRREIPGPDEVVREGLIYRQKGDKVVLCVPDNRELKMELISSIHDVFHFGSKRTLHEVRRLLWWKNMAEDVKKYVRECAVCQRAKPGNCDRRASYFPLEHIPYAFHTLVMDEVTGLPETNSGCNAVLTVVDRFSKYVTYIPMNTRWSSEDVAKAVMARVLMIYQTPSKVITDNGTRFRKVFDEMCKILGIHLVHCTPYHSKSQGAAERQHRTLLSSLRCMKDTKEWDEVLPMVAYGYNTSLHPVTGYRPYTIVFGEEPRMPWAQQLPGLQEMPERQEYLPIKLKEKKRIFDEVRRMTARQTLKLKEKENRNRAGREYQVGELVKMQAGEYSPSDRPKLSDYWIGPYTVTKVLGKGAYEVALPDGTQFHSKVNADRLDYWHTSDLSDYPEADKAEKEDGRYRVRRYLLRDFGGIPGVRQRPRYWVEGTSEDAANRYFYVDEDDEVLEDILRQEEQYGCLPERGINAGNVDEVERLKVEVYGLDPSPILQNTWTGQLPYTTRTQPTFKLPQRMEDVINGVVHSTWRMTDGQDLWYQALVFRRTGDTAWIRWTDGREEEKDFRWLKAHWYNPMELVYHFKG